MKSKQLLSLFLAASVLSLASCEQETTSSSPSQSPSDTGSSQTTPSETPSESESTPEPAVDYSISQITAKDQSYTVRGVIDAKTTKGFVITDGAASVYVYLEAEPSSYALGDYVEVSGKTGAFNGMFQFTKEAKITKLTETPSFTIPEPATLTMATAASWQSKTSFAVTESKEYKWRSTAGEADGFNTLNLAGSEVTIEPSYMPSEFNIEVGATYDVTAYFAGFAGEKYGNYAAVYLTSLSKVDDGDTPDPDPEPSDDYSISQITETGAYTIRGVVDAMTSAGCVISDGINAIYYHDYDVADLVSLNDYIEITGDVMKHYGMFQFRYGSKITVLDEEPNITIPSPTPLTAEIVTGWTAATDYSIEAFKKYSWTSTAGTTISGDKTYDTLNIDGSNILIEPSYLLSTFDIVTGETYNVTAYFGGYSTEHSYAAMYVTDLVLAD